MEKPPRAAAAAAGAAADAEGDSFAADEAEPFGGASAPPRDDDGGSGREEEVMGARIPNRGVLDSSTKHNLSSLSTGVEVDPSTQVIERVTVSHCHSPSRRTAHSPMAREWRCRDRPRAPEHPAGAGGPGSPRR